jgi:catechol 2,3-dioxygenase-like lactoylglutathione lyase family enzyme
LAAKEQRVQLRSIEAKAFVPARDFATSKRFYQDLGFGLVWSTDELAYFRHDHSVFLLQNFFVQEFVNNFKMHLLVERVDDWWEELQVRGIVRRYGVRAEPPADRPWGLRDFVLFDPSDVMWRIGQSLRNGA